MQTDKQFGIVGKRMILAVAAAGLPFDVDGASGLHTRTESMMLGMLHNAGLWIGPRDVLEGCNLYRQIIPYVVLRHEGNIVYYQRTPAGGEGRLHGKISIGFGGHIDVPDISYFCKGDTVDLAATLSCAADREVHEELGSVSVRSKQVLGLLVDNSNEVGLVHIGVVMVWDLDQAPVNSSPEDEIANVGSGPLNVLREASTKGNYEEWSRMLLATDFLIPPQVAPRVNPADGMSREP